MKIIFCKLKLENETNNMLSKLTIDGKKSDDYISFHFHEFNKRQNSAGEVSKKINPKVEGSDKFIQDDEK